MSDLLAHLCLLHSSDARPLARVFVDSIRDTATLETLHIEYQVVNYSTGEIYETVTVAPEDDTRAFQLALKADWERKYRVASLIL